MESSNNDIENNRRIAVIEESINIALLSANVFLGVIIITMVILIVIIVLKNFN